MSKNFFNSVFPAGGTGLGWGTPSGRMPLSKLEAETCQRIQNYRRSGIKSSADQVNREAPKPNIVVVNRIIYL